MSATDPGLTTRSRQDRDTAPAADYRSPRRVWRGATAPGPPPQLKQHIADQGLPAAPATWLRVVGSGAAEENPYVISQITAQRADIPRPDTPNRPYSVT